MNRERLAPMTRLLRSGTSAPLRLRPCDCGPGDYARVARRWWMRLLWPRRRLYLCTDCGAYQLLQVRPPRRGMDQAASPSADPAGDPARHAGPADGVADGERAHHGHP